jgi:sugar/nucleoside kinase (ribokinase family)
VSTTFMPTAVAGFGSVNIDYIVPGPTGVAYFDAFEEGLEHEEYNYERLASQIVQLKVRRPDLRVECGGSAVNMVRALKALAPDLKAGLVTVAGQGRAALPLIDLTEAGIDVDLDDVPGPCGVCVSIILGEHRTLVTYNNPATAAALRDRRVRRRLVARLAKTDLVHITSILGGADPRHVALLIREIRRMRPEVTISVDPGNVWAARRETREVLAEANIIFTNEHELELLAPLNLPPSEDHVEARAPQSAAVENSRCMEILQQISRREERIVVLKKRERLGRDSSALGRAGTALYYKTNDNTDVEYVQLMEEALPPGTNRRFHGRRRRCGCLCSIGFALPPDALPVGATAS